MTDQGTEQGKIERGDELTDAQLDQITGGDGKTTTTTTKGTKPSQYLVVTQESTLISST